MPLFAGIETAKPTRFRAIVNLSAHGKVVKYRTLNCPKEKKGAVGFVDTIAPMTPQRR